MNPLPKCVSIPIGGMSQKATSISLCFVLSIQETIHYPTSGYSPKSGYTPIDGGAGYCDRQGSQSRRRYAASQEAIDSFCAYSPHSIKTHHIHGIPTLDGTLFEQRTNTMLSVIHMLFGLVQLGSLRNMKRATRHQASHHDAGLRNQRIKAHAIGSPQKKLPPGLYM